MDPIMRKVLIVDDDAALRDALEAVLVLHGHVVTGAQDGLAALRAAVETRPEVIISDVNMPFLEGPDAVRILKAIERFRHVPVVLMSGAELPVTGLAQLTLRKPVAAGQILDLVEDLGWATVSPAPVVHGPPPPASHAQESWNASRARASFGPTATLNAQPVSARVSSLCTPRQPASTDCDRRR